MIRLENIKKSYGDKSVLRGVSLSLGNTEKVAVMGASGCGKTTLLRIAAGLESADAGDISHSPDKLKISFCFAEPRLFPNATVLENVMCVLPREERADGEVKCRRILSDLGISAFSAYPRELSTGMAQRVSLARAVAWDAPLFLLDEPFRGLDKSLRDEAVSYMRGVLSEKSAIIITHDPDEAAALADKIYLMSDGTLTEKI